MTILDDTLTLVLAGGRGQRLLPLTRERSKPAVPFGGMYRIVDIGRGARINSVIIDKCVRVPPNMIIGEDPKADKKRFFVTDSGIVVIPKETDLSGP